MTNKPRWMIVQTRPGAELRAACDLEDRLGFRVWLWKTNRQEPYGSPSKRLTRPKTRAFFSGYLFVRESGRTEELLTAVGVTGYLREATGEHEPKPELVSHDALTRLGDLLGRDEDNVIPLDKVRAKPILSAGTLVMIRKDKAFVRLAARLKHSVPFEDRQRMKGYVEAFGRETEIEFTGAQIEEVVS